MKNLFTISVLAVMIILVGCNHVDHTDSSDANEYEVDLVANEKNSDYMAVESTILDYVEGIYEVDSTRIERSVHPELRKRGYWFSDDKGEYSGHLDMSYEQLVHLAATWNDSGERANAKSPKSIDIYEVNDKTASAKLTAEWGVDYFHLVKMDDKWMIMNVIWQSTQE